MTNENIIKVALIGSSGLLGQSIVAACIKLSNFIIYEFNRKDLHTIDRFINSVESISPDFLICTIAIPSNKRCMDDPLNALLSNLTKPLHILSAVKKLGLHSIIFSSHGVFSGKSSISHYTDIDLPAPNTFHGHLKFELETLAQECFSEKVTIIRLPSLYGNRLGPGHLGVCERIIKDLKKNIDLNVRVDMYDTFTCVDDVADYLLINIKEITSHKIIHIANEGVASLYEFALLCKQFTESQSKIIPLQTLPHYQLTCNALQSSSILGAIPMNKWDHALELFLRNKYG